MPFSTVCYWCKVFMVPVQMQMFRMQCHWCSGSGSRMSGLKMWSASNILHQAAGIITDGLGHILEWEHIRSICILCNQSAISMCLRYSVVFSLPQLTTTASIKWHAKCCETEIKVIVNPVFMKLNIYQTIEHIFM